MELQNMPKAVLFKICPYLDRKSKLNLMLTSKFFNNLIGGNPELCEFIRKKNQINLILKQVFLGEAFEPLYITRNFPLKYLKECTRCFGSIHFADYACNSEYFEAVSALLKSIGFGVKEVTFRSGSLKAGDLAPILSLIPNVEKIAIFRVRIVNSAFPAIAHGFKKLKKLLLCKHSGRGVRKL
jgi:hypothetical protein